MIVGWHQALLALSQLLDFSTLSVCTRYTVKSLDGCNSSMCRNVYLHFAENVEVILQSNSDLGILKVSTWKGLVYVEEANVMTAVGIAATSHFFLAMAR